MKITRIVEELEPITKVDKIKNPGKYTIKYTNEQCTPESVERTIIVQGNPQINLKYDQLNLEIGNNMPRPTAEKEENKCKIQKADIKVPNDIVIPDLPQKTYNSIHGPNTPRIDDNAKKIEYEITKNFNIPSSLPPSLPPSYDTQLFNIDSNGTISIRTDIIDLIVNFSGEQVDKLIKALEDFELQVTLKIKYNNDKEEEYTTTLENFKEKIKKIINLKTNLV